MLITYLHKTAPHKVRLTTLCGAFIIEHDTLLVIYYIGNYKLRPEYDNDKNVSVDGAISCLLIGNLNKFSTDNTEII